MAKKRKTDEPKPTGRPSLYSEELADEICVRLMAGESLRKICEEEKMPERMTIFRWLAQDEHPFVTKYARAREVQAEGLADDLIEIADETSNDTLFNDSGGTRPNIEYIQRSKLRIETRQWIASKLLPKKFGNKQEIDINGGGPLQINLTETIIEGGART